VNKAEATPRKGKPTQKKLKIVPAEIMQEDNIESDSAVPVAGAATAVS
jgi:hypothetical protein